MTKAVKGRPAPRISIWERYENMSSKEQKAIDIHVSKKADEMTEQKNFFGAYDEAAEKIFAEIMSDEAAIGSILENAKKEEMRINGISNRLRQRI